MRIYLFRGLGEFPSGGMDDLRDSLNELGHRASSHSWLGRGGIERKLLKQIDEGTIPPEIAICGHSLGANSTSILVDRLAIKGYNVAYAATLDVPNPTDLPTGVPADNFMSNWGLAKEWNGATKFSFNDIGHTDLDDHPPVHNRIIAMVADAEAITVAGNAKQHTHGGNSENLTHLLGKKIKVPIDQLDTQDILRIIEAHLADKSNPVIGEATPQIEELEPMLDKLVYHAARSTIATAVERTSKETDKSIRSDHMIGECLN